MAYASFDGELDGEAKAVGFVPFDGEMDAPKKRTWGEAAKDGANSFGASVNNTLKTLTDLAGVNNPASAFLDENAKTWQGNYSPAYKEELQRQVGEKEALGGDPSYAARAGLMARQVIRNPVEGVGELAGNIAPMLVGGIAGAGVKGMTALSAAMGAGAVKGGIAETVQNAPDADLMPDPLYAEMRNSGMSEQDAKAGLSEQRASYGDAYGKILLGAGIGAAVGRFGSVENAIASMGKRTAAQAQVGLLKGVGTGVAKEVATEIPQEMTETYLGNKGAASQGASIAADQGVIESGVKAGILSAVGGGVAGMTGRGASQPAPIPSVTPADILSDSVTSVDQAISLAQVSLATPSNLSATATGTQMAAPPVSSAGPGFDARSVAGDYIDQQDLSGLVESETRNLQVMRAQLAQEQEKSAQLDALQDQSAQELGRLPDQQVAAAMAATDETPTAMQLAMQRAQDKAVNTPQKAPDGTTDGVIPGLDATGDARGPDAGTSLADGGRVFDDAGQPDANPAEVAVADSATGVAARPGTADAVAFDYVKSKSGTLLVNGDPVAIRAAFPQEHGITKFTDGQPTGVLFGIKSAPQVEAVLLEPELQGLTAAAFEQLHQQDVKQEIKQRLDLAKPAEVDQKKTPFKSFLREFGVNSEHTSDIAGKNRFNANNVLPATFRANGMSLDGMVDQAIERGFMQEGDRGNQNKLIGMIQAEIAGETQVSSEFADVDAQQQAERFQRAEIESQADQLGLPYDASVSVDRLASMVRRVQARMAKELDASFNGRGSLKSDRVLKAAQETVARIERKRAQYERESRLFAENSIAEQEAILEILADEDGNPVILRLAEMDAQAAWVESQQQWNEQNGQADATEHAAARQAETPATGISEEGVSNTQGVGTQAQHRSTEASGAADESQEGVAKPLYASRAVTNAADIIAWAQSQGFKTTLPADDMHVTVAYSSQPVDGSRAGNTTPSVIINGGTRTVEPLGDDGAVVLKFSSDEMQARWKQYRDAGASWDYEGYTPHVTLTYDADGIDLSKVTPYAGPIQLGAEKQESLNEDKADEYVEEPTLTAPTRDDVLAQQDRAGNAEALDNKAQIDAEASRQTLTRQTAPEQRTDTSGDMFAVEKAQAEIDKRNAGVQAAKDPNQPGMFDESSDPITETKATLDANNVTGKERLDVIKDVKSGALTVAEVQEAYPSKIDDVGEKIGGARKDTAISTGTKRKTEAQDDGRPTWAKRFQISQIAKGFDMSVNGRDITGKWTISDTRNKDRFDQPKKMGGYFDSKEEAEAALPLLAVAQKHRVTSTAKDADGAYRYEIWRDINDRKRVKVVAQDFATRDDAMRYMGQHATEILETNTTFGESDIPKPESTERKGVERRTGDVKGEDFRDAFGFRGVEFGLWNNQAERQEVMNAAYDGLMDLADVLNIPPKAIGLNGDLALAFGARGKGLTGARAHYETNRVVMNLTKMNGAGALAHEWLHALDHYLARQDGKTTAEWKVNKDGTRSLDVHGGEADMASSGFRRTNSGVREELRAAYASLVQSLFTKAEQYVEDTARADKFVAVARGELEKDLNDLRKDLSEQKDVRYYKRNNKPASAEQLAEFDAMAAELVEGRGLSTEWKTMPGKTRLSIQTRHTNETLEKLNELYKAVRGRSGFNAEHRGVLDALSGYMKRYDQRMQMLREATALTTKTKRVPTSFAMDAKSLDQGRGGDYWTSPHEMVARAFQGYIEDKIAAKDGKSPFLNYAPENAGILTPWGAKRPFPAGEERKAMNGEFDKFVSTIQTKEDDAGNVAMFSRADSIDVSDPRTGISSVLLELGKINSLYQYPRSGKSSPEDIAADKGMTISDVDRNAEDGKLWMIANTTPTDAPGVKSWIVTLPGGKHATLTNKNGEVYINVSAVGEGQGGSLVYDLAANYAFNNDLKFIGDPNGVSPAAMRRRLENMLSAAIKYGSTDFLAPHADQVEGRPDIGVPALRWTEGDTLGNIRAMVDVSIKANDHANPGTTRQIDFRPDTQSFGDGKDNAIDDRKLADYLSNVLGTERRPRGTGHAGDATLRRNALFNSLLQSVGNRTATMEFIHRQQDRGGSGIGGALEGTFYSQQSAVRNPSTVERVQSAVTEFIGGKQLPSQLGRVVATTAAEIKSHWEALIDKSVNIGSEGDAGVAQAFYDPRTKTVFLIADHISQGNETAVLAHELMHKHGQTVLGKDGWTRLHGVISSWEHAPADSEERAVYSYARNKVAAVGNHLSSQELFPYAVEAALKMGIQPSMAAKKGTVARWLESVRQNMQQVWGKITGKPESFKTQDLVDLAFGIAQRENPAHASISLRAKDQTETPAFKKWFGDSKVVDAYGKPLVVYHGSGRSIKEFWSSSDRGGLIYFTKDVDAAHHFADDSAANQNDNGNYDDEYGRKSEDGGAAIYPVYLSIQNPFDADNPTHVAKLPKEAATRIRLGEYSEVEQYAEDMRSAGFDGAYVRETPDVKADNRDIAAFDPKQIKSATGNNGDFDGTKPDIRFSRTAGNPHSWDAPEASKFDDLVYKLQDKQIDTKRVVESIKTTAGALADEKNVYLQEELFHGRAAARTEDFVNKELGPLIREMQMRGIDIATLDEYLHARHAEEANDLIAQRNPDILDGGSGMTTQAARDYLAKLGPAERKRLDAAAAKVDAILADTRQLYADYGLESADTVKGWGAMFKHYVPLMREDKDGGMGIGQGFSIKGKETKGRTGSIRKVVDILANIAMQRERAIVRGEKNRVAMALVGLVKTSPNTDFWQVGPPPMEKVYDPKTDSVVERADPMYKSRDNVVVAKVKQADGSVTEQAVVFNEDNERALRMASALKNLDAAQLEGLLGVSAKITRYFAAINTQYNPIFGTVNLVRDFQGALLNLSATPLKGHAKEIAGHTLSALKGIYLDARAARDGKTPSSKWAQLWDEFQDQGGQTGFRDLFSNSADRAKAIERELNPTAWMDGPLGKVFTAGGALKVPLELAQKKATGMFDWLSDYNLAMENAVRLSAYKVALEQGMSKQQAASLGKNLTVNFNRKGQVGQQAGALYAFFNASMQGSARLGKTLFDMDGSDVKSIRLSVNGKKIVYGGILLGTMQALLLAAAGFDDDEPPDFVRERSLIIPTGGKGYITIPMPLGLHVLPNIGRIPTEFVLGGYKHPERQVAKLMGLVAGAFNPIGGGASLVQMLSPTAVDPLVALAENKDWTGKPIAKTAYNQAIPGHLLAKDTASYPAKLLAEAINAMTGGTEYTAGVMSPTPDQIDYLWGQATGGVGRELSKAQQSVSASISGEDLPIHKIPLVGRFYGNADTPSAQSGKFYSVINDLNEHELEIKGLRKDGKGAEAAQYLRDNPEARLFQMGNAAERDIQNLRGKKRELIAKGAPAETVKMVELRIAERMTRFNAMVKRLSEKQPA